MLNYTVPPFQFLIGGFDASEYLDSISLSAPMHELGQALLWSGQFTVSNNLKARANGLTDADFSEFGTPTRWRPYQQLVRLNIRGYQSPAFRIEDYRYNAQTRTGEGRLTQIPTAVAGDRPGEKIETVVSGVIQAAINNLITAAFRGATVTPGRSLHADNGVLDVPLSTRNPWADALRLSSLNWHWLTVNTAESIVSIPGDGSLIFSRTAEQVELAPDLAAIYQSANEVIVTGARQVPDNTNVATTTTPTAPRPKVKTTTENRPSGSVFPSLGTSTTPMVFEEKTIIYQYWDDDSWVEYLPGLTNPLVDFLFDIQSPSQSGINIYGEPPANLATPLQTITIKRQPQGFLFPALGTSTTLAWGEIIIESNLRKLLLKPVGVLFPSLGTDFDLAIEKRETLTSELIPPGTDLTVPKLDENGQPQKYEPRPKLEQQQPLPPRKLKTELLRGSSRISPVGWSPVIRKPLVVDFGFLPDQFRAETLARRIGEREQRRRDQVLVDMPVPDEWLSNGWPLLRRCSIGGDVYLMDGCAVSITDDEAKFAFTGALVSRSVAGVPTALYSIEVEVEPEILFEAIITTGLAAIVVGDLVLEPIVSMEIDGGGYGYGYGY
jgi:hypothetical protein